MENKRLRAFAIFIIIGFVFIVNFAFFGVGRSLRQSSQQTEVVQW